MITKADIPAEPMFVVEVIDKENDIEGWVAIHSFGANGSCGGLRLYPDVTREEVEILAKGMTYKYCFHEIPTGGAKAGLKLSFDLSPTQRADKLRKFGRHIAPLLNNNIYFPWTDMNCSTGDLANLFEGAGKKFYPSKGDSSYYTALSTYSGVIAVAKHLSIPMENCKIAIQGLGNVGKFLASEIKASKSKLIAASTRLGGVYNSEGLNIDEVISAIEKNGDLWVTKTGNWQQISCDELFSLEMDILIPSARIFSVTEQIARTIKCKAVVSAANSPCTEAAIEIFGQRGILVLPYFVTNSGGVVGPGLENCGDTDTNIREIFYSHFSRMLERMFKCAASENSTLIDVAKNECVKNFSKHSFVKVVKKYFVVRAVKAIQRRIFKRNKKNLGKLKSAIICSINDKFV